MHIRPTLAEEQVLWEAGYRRVAGVDEAGVGALAGPVVAAAVVLPVDPMIADVLGTVADSKVLSPAQREALFTVIMTEARAVGVGVVGADRIDAAGIAPATRAAMALAIDQLQPAPDFLLLDYVRLSYLPLRQRSLVNGDAHVLSIAAASIVAKVTRDRLMDDLAQQYPAYGFDHNRGYGTAFHLTALQQTGPCPIHRHSYRPVRGLQRSLFS